MDPLGSSVGSKAIQIFWDIGSSILKLFFGKCFNAFVCHLWSHNTEEEFLFIYSRGRKTETGGGRERKRGARVKERVKEANSPIIHSLSKCL